MQGKGWPRQRTLIERRRHARTPSGCKLLPGEGAKHTPPQSSPTFTTVQRDLSAAQQQQPLCRESGLLLRRAAVTAVTVRKFDNLAAAPVPFFLSGLDSSSFFKSSRELIALVRAYAGYTKPAAASSSAASEGDDDLDDEESQEPEGENDHLPE
ncbi:hypothetical protein T492DRAFT_857249 [Pavlovales sp. CCMP2436]|nr:hypothetical protein T492DRAFT_857249 [Pavlovales sp. CCMP2436]